MSLELNRDTVPSIVVKTWTPKGVHLDDPVNRDEMEIGIRDFCTLVEYVLTNTDLVPCDPRLELVEKIKKIQTVEGWNPKHQRLDIK